MKFIDLDAQGFSATTEPGEELLVRERGKVHTIRITWDPPLPESAIVVVLRGEDGGMGLTPLLPTPSAGGVQPLAGAHRPEEEPAARKRGRHGRPDEFYAQIADLYRWHGPNGSAGFVAELYEVPKTTAQRWIREARRRGILEPFTERECHACGRAHTAASLQFDRDRRSRWKRGM